MDTDSDLKIEEQANRDQRSKNVWKTLTEMLTQRGFTFEEKGEPLEINGDKEYIVVHHHKTDDKIMVFPKIFERLNVDQINFISVLQREKVNHAIIVYEGTITPLVKNVLANALLINLEIEAFKSEDLQYNITKHELVPLHEKASKQEVVQIAKKLPLNKLPYLLRTDPVCRFYNFQKGNVIRVTRRSGFVAYRIVI